jgi:hypothetical protein
MRKPYQRIPAVKTHGERDKADKRREKHCEHMPSRQTQAGDNELPGPQGSCEKESLVQGSE